MFRNTIVVRANLPSSSASPFLLRRISLPLDLSPPPLPSPPSLAVDVEIICWRISRRWRLACFLHSPEIFVIYQRNQLESIDRALEELVKALPVFSVNANWTVCSLLSLSDRLIRFILCRAGLILDVDQIGDEEEAASASLIAKVMEIWLRTVMLDHKWACIGDNTYVDSTFAGSDHRNYVGALNLRIQPETEDGMVLLVSPEFLRFSRHKVADLVGSEVWKSLDSSKQLMLEGYNFSKACTIIPSLSEAQVLGVCKLLPDEESFEKLELLWSLKHGLSLSSDYFIAVRSIYSSHANKWFPSACILQGHGFSPAPRSIRSSNAMGTLVSFIEQLIAWDFFSCGHLNIKEVLPLDLGTRIPVWIKAATHFAGYMERNKENANSQNCFGEIDLFSREPMPSLDFRTPKPGICSLHGNRGLRQNNVQCSSSFLGSEYTVNGVNTCPDKRAHQAMQPSFTKRKLVNVHKDRISQSQVKDFHVSEEKHFSADSSRSEDPPMRSKSSRRKIEKTKAAFAKTSSASTGKVHMTQDLVENLKMWAKKSIDQSVITGKVMNCYKRGELQSLTVFELKCFLTSKKAKVGGNKEELIK